MKIPSGLRYWFKDDFFDEWHSEVVYSPILKECVSHGKPWIIRDGRGTREFYGVAIVDPSADGHPAKREKKARA